MDYQVLARKWRPRSFETLVGQEHVVRALTNALDTGRIHHAWLFTGTRGVGKTTLARILAKCLNCESGISSHPTDCQTCREIDEGRFVDYIEVDAASNRGVDEITPLLEQAVYPPSQGRFKIYTIDEVHMLSGHAFNAMLKTLEEPPPHLKFILATTDPQKIPITVLSRCIQYNLKRMTPEAIVSHLQYVLQQESIHAEEAGLRLIAQAAAGSMRDALSLTDQAIAYSSGSITGQAMQDMLGTIDSGYLIHLLEALTHNRPPEIIKLADALAERSASFDAALSDFALMLSKISMEQRIPGTLSRGEPHYEKLLSLASQLPPDLLQLFYVIALNGRSELPRAPDEYAGFVMICLRMLSLTSGEDVRQCIGQAAEAQDHASRLSSSAAGATPLAATSGLPAAADISPASTGQTKPKKDSSGAAPGGHTASQPLAKPAAAASQASPGASLPASPQIEPAPEAQATGNNREAVSTAVPKPEPSGEGKVDLPWYEDDHPRHGTQRATAAVSAEPAPPESHAAGTQAGGPPLTPSRNPGAGDASSGQSQTRTGQGGQTASGHTAERPAPMIVATTASAPPLTPGKPAASSISRHTDSAERSLETSQRPASVGVSVSSPDDDYAEYYSSELNASSGTDDDVELNSDLIYQNPEPLAPASEKPSHPAPEQLTPQLWTEVVRELPVTGLAAEMLKNTEWVRTENNLIVLRSFFGNAENMRAMKDITTALTEYFSRVIRLTFIKGQTSGDTVSAQDALKLAKRLEKAKSDIHSDPFVQGLIRDFAASVRDDSIQLLK